jgi:hypothetical protein
MEKKYVFTLRLQKRNIIRGKEGCVVKENEPKKIKGLFPLILVDRI